MATKFDSVKNLLQTPTNDLWQIDGDKYHFGVDNKVNILIEEELKIYGIWSIKGIWKDDKRKEFLTFEKLFKKDVEVNVIDNDTFSILHNNKLIKAVRIKV